MADLAKLNKDKTETIKVFLTLNDEPLMNDGDDPTQMSITFNSPMSKAYREVEFDLQDEAIEDLKSDADSFKSIDSRKMYHIRVNKVAKNAVDWDITMNGRPKFTYDAAYDFFMDYPVFLYQAEAGINKEAGFTLS